jgi:hypothetical protein
MFSYFLVFFWFHHHHKTPTPSNPRARAHRTRIHHGAPATLSGDTARGAHHQGVGQQGAAGAGSSCLLLRGGEGDACVEIAAMGTCPSPGHAWLLG